MLHRKRKVSRESIIVIIGTLVILIGFVLFNFERINLFLKDYSFSEQSVILNLDDETVKRFLNNSELIDIKSWNDIDNDKHYLEYQKYQEYNKQLSKKEVVGYIDTFYDKYYKKLIKLNYTYDQMISLMKHASINDFQILIDNNYSYSKIQPYLNINGITFKDINKYISSNKEPIEAVLMTTYPFINSKNHVTKEYQILQPEKLDVLIKKGFVLSKDYEPKELVIPNIPIAPDCNNKKLRKDAAKALEEMYQDALKKGYHLVLNSGYRSYESQMEIYEEYFRKYDKITASKLVSKPGSSEHQLGLGVDLTSQSVVDKKRMVFGDSDEYKWVIKNAHKYGFILRYPKDRSSFTGIANEPWHFRYVGKKIAKIIYDNDWILEDYILKYGFDYELKMIR